MADAYWSIFEIDVNSSIADTRATVKERGAAEAERWFEEGPVKEFLKADAPALQVLLPYAGEFCREYEKLVLYAAAKGETEQLERLLRMEGGLTKARVKKALAAADDAGQDATVEMLMGLLAEAPAKYVPAPLSEGQVDMPAKEAKELFALENRGPASVAILRYRADAPDVVVPARINGKRVAAICEDAFADCESLESVVLTEGLARIGLRAFCGCIRLSDVRIPSGCAVDSNTFMGCWALRGLYAANYPAPSANLRVGDVVAFGSTRWRVLALEGGKMLLHACDVVCSHQYHCKDEAVTWEACTLRAWLNGEYLERAFSKEERRRITETLLPNPDNAKYGTRGGADTADRVFLLSIEEATVYYAGAEDKSCDEIWGLRSPGGRQDFVAHVQYDGTVSECGWPARGWASVRPAIWVNL